MPKALIKIAYRQIIDAAAQTAFEKDILAASYKEYKMKQQTYNTEGTIHTFTALKEKDGRANSLHYKSGFAIAGIIDSLKNKITILQDGNPETFVFDVCRFEIIESDITDQQKHKVALHYTSAILTLYQIIGEYLLVAKGDKTIETAGEPAETFLVKVQPGLQVVNYKEFASQDYLNFINNIL